MQLWYSRYRHRDLRNASWLFPVTAGRNLGNRLSDYNTLSVMR